MRDLLSPRGYVEVRSSLGRVSTGVVAGERFLVLREDRDWDSCDDDMVAVFDW